MRRSAATPRSRGFTLIEAIIAVFLLALAMLGLLAVFDASARINKSEQDVADAQGSVRYGIYQMTRVIRMAGSGGLFVTQAVLNQSDPELTDANTTDTTYDNVPPGQLVGGTPVRPGTDMIEIRGVILSPLLAFDGQGGCAPCNTSNDVLFLPDLWHPLLGQHVNNDAANRPQFAEILTRTASAAAQNAFVLVSADDNIHGACTGPVGPNQPLAPPAYPQPTYNVGLLDSPGAMAGANLNLPGVDFAAGIARQFCNEDPSVNNAAPTPVLNNLRRGGVLDVLIYFIDDTDPTHPSLAQGIRRGNNVEVVRLADDVEDMQVAYGVDVDATADGIDPGLSPAVGNDEFTPNAIGEAAADPNTFAEALNRCPRLHSVMISLLARSRDPDPTLLRGGPSGGAGSALGYRLMNVAMTGGTPPVPVTVNSTRPYRRRVQTLQINLRNYSFSG
jgi:type II secretory pathway pseudopilin PulG